MSYPGHTLGEVLSLCRDAVSVSYSPSQLGLDGLVSYPGHLLVLPFCRDAVSVSYSPSHLGLDGLVLYLRHFLGGLTPLQRCSQCILQPQPTGLRLFSVISRALIGRSLIPLQWIGHITRNNTQDWNTNEEQINSSDALVCVLTCQGLCLKIWHYVTSYPLQKGKAKAVVLATQFMLNWDIGKHSRIIFKPQHSGFSAWRAIRFKKTFLIG